MDQTFDVFLCHNSEDKTAVIEIAEKLKTRNIRPWLDIWELRPGMDWQEILEAQIGQIRAAAVFVGDNGLGPWQNKELKAFLREFDGRHSPIIPVLLGNASKEPKLPMFLKGNTWVDLRTTIPDPLDQMIWGVTGIKPTAEEIGSTLDPSPVTHDNRKSSLEQLETLLLEQNWKDADRMTTQIILKTNQGKKLTAPKLRRLPSNLLVDIDNLWMRHSNSRFGLRIQYEIWQSCFIPDRTIASFFIKAKPITASQAWNSFGCLTGWRDCEERPLPDNKIDFSNNAPPGCFPQSRRWLNNGFGHSATQFDTLMKRVSQSLN